MKAMVCRIARFKCRSLPSHARRWQEGCGACWSWAFRETICSWEGSTRRDHAAWDPTRPPFRPSRTASHSAPRKPFRKPPRTCPSCTALWAGTATSPLASRTPTTTASPWPSSSSARRSTPPRTPASPSCPPPRAALVHPAIPCTRSSDPVVAISAAGPAPAQRCRLAALAVTRAWNPQNWNMTPDPTWLFACKASSTWIFEIRVKSFASQSQIPLWDHACFRWTTLLLRPQISSRPAGPEG